MELVLRFGKNELCIDHQEGSIGFVVLTDDNRQIDFDINAGQWEQLKTFIDDSVSEYQYELKTKKSVE